MIILINIELALLSLPISLNLFVMSYVTGRPVGRVLHSTIPSFAIMLLPMLVTFIPALSTWLNDGTAVQICPELSTALSPRGAVYHTENTSSAASKFIAHVLETRAD